MDCYVINLPQEIKRLARTAQELTKYCPRVTWRVPQMFVASELSDAEFAGLYDSISARKIFGRDLCRGEVACALSHQSAMKAFLKTRREACLIVEDDVLLSPALGDFLDGLERWLEGFNRPLCVILSEAAAVRYWTARAWIGDIKRTRPLFVYGALAYVLNREGAELILEANRVPICTLSDQWPFYERKGLHVFGVDKILAGSHDFSRAESSLARGRAEAYRNRPVSKKQTLRRRISQSICSRVKSLWWFITGVCQVGADRSNARVYKYDERGGV